MIWGYSTTALQSEAKAVKELGNFTFQCLETQIFLERWGEVAIGCCWNRLQRTGDNPDSYMGKGLVPDPKNCLVPDPGALGSFLTQGLGPDPQGFLQSRVKCWRSLNLQTCERLLELTHMRGYATDGVVWGTFLELARMQDAPQLMVWGGVGMMTFLELTHMGDATQLMVWGGWGIMTFLLLHTCEMLQNVLSPRIWDYVHQFVYRHNTDLWAAPWRTKTTFFRPVLVDYKYYRNNYETKISLEIDWSLVWSERCSEYTLHFASCCWAKVFCICECCPNGRLPKSNREM